MVARVKAHTPGTVTVPAVVAPSATLSELDAMKRGRGFSSAVVTDSGAVGGKVVGIVTTRDCEGVFDRSTAVSAVMTRDVVTADVAGAPEALRAALLASKKGKLPLVDAAGRLVALVTRAESRAAATRPRRARTLFFARSPPLWDTKLCGDGH